MKSPRLPLRYLLRAIPFAALAAPGCEPKPEDGVANPVSKADVFRTPAPRQAGDDPRVAEAASAGDAVAQSLAVIHKRLRELEKAYDTKARTEEDLAAVTRRMHPLLAAARADCDAILRATKDLRAQLPYAQAGYASAAASYRMRAEGYRDPALREVTIRIAERFEREGQDIPRRLALTDAFIKQLEEAQVFLSDTDRCLRDTATALAVFSAGRHEPDVSADGRTFKRRLEQFIAVVAEYHGKLLSGAPSAGTARPTPPAATGAMQAATAAGSELAAGAPNPPDPSPLDGVIETITGHRVWWGAGDDDQRAAPDRSADTRANATMLPVGFPGPRVRIAVEGAPSAAAGDHPLAAGIVLSGESATPARGLRLPVTLTVRERAGDGFSGVMEYGTNGAYGRRGVRGRVSADGRLVTIWAEWFDGNVSPEAIRYDLEGAGESFSGRWETPTLRGTIRLGPGPA